MPSLRTHAACGTDVNPVIHGVTGTQSNDLNVLAWGLVKARQVAAKIPGNILTQQAQPLMCLWSAVIL